MKRLIRLFYTTLALMIFSVSVARADTLLIETLRSGDQITVPARGHTMAEVEGRFGAADNRYDAVGEPPITRWVYPNFIVYFEYDRVIHSVVYRALTGTTQQMNSDGNTGMEDKSAAAEETADMDAEDSSMGMEQ